MCTSFAPASLMSFTILAEVVPLTMESSISMTLFPFITSDMGLSFILTRFSLDFWLGAMKVLPIYLFFISPTP